jgi:Flp pilus assembly protein TadD
LDAQDVTALHHRGNVLLALGRYEEARQDYQQALKIESGDGGIWNNYGIALDGLGRTNDAVQAYRRAAECQPPSKSAFLGLAFDQLKSGRLDDAAGVLDQLDKLEKGPNVVALAIRSVLARDRGEAAKAVELERQARELDLNTAKWAIERASNANQTK